MSATIHNFKFPADGEDVKQPAVQAQRKSSLAQSMDQKASRAPKESRRAQIVPEAPYSARNSVDFYSLSNHSQETLASEQPSIVPEQRLFASPALRKHYKMDSPKPRPRIESLLMGYAQIAASFTLDGALVDQSPFEEVKRKGFLGGQGGGGVVGVQSVSSSSGLLKGFNLNSIGESLGGILGGQDLSSLKEMKDNASSQSVPLLSTPQSLLFVDLTMAPGEEKSFSFTFTLPHGLPASYKGRAIKISYDLIVGVQGLPGEKSVQPIRRVNFPFKVFSGVNDDGEILGHDMMQPHVILQTTAQTEQVPSPWSFAEPFRPVKDDEGGLQDFMQHVDSLLSKLQRRQSSSGALDHPRDARDGESSRAKQAIDFAIMTSKQNSQQSRNRFEIARNGKSVATIVLDRTLLRLGETLTASIDISKGQKPCYSLRCALESTEQVNPALALRSAASITRMSRKIYASQSENTLFAQRAVFSPSIPVRATPTFSTSGVNLHWALRFEFVTSQDKRREKEVEGESSEEEDEDNDTLLEPVTVDDRGSIIAAVESLDCESFEASIPITVYGDKVVAEADGDTALGLPI